jgi:hypothetical protein
MLSWFMMFDISQCLCALPFCYLLICFRSFCQSFIGHDMANSSTSSIEFNANVCAVCHAELDISHSDGTWITLTDKGLKTLLHFSELKSDSALQAFLVGNPQVVNVHVECRKNYTSKRRYEQDQKKKAESHDAIVSPLKQLRSSQLTFNWQTDCFFCTQPVVFDARHPDRCDSNYVRTLESRSNIIATCRERNDEWGLQVLSRLNTCCDLVAADGVNHRNFFRNFSCFRSNIPNESLEPGRKKDESKLKSFKQLCEWLEDADNLYTLSELHEKLQEIAGHGVEVYCKKSLEEKLVEKYNDHIFFAQVCGRNNVVCFKNMASSIISDKWYADRKTNIEEESQRIVVAAAKLIKAQIRGAKYVMDHNPLNTHISNLQTAKDWVPSLQIAFMENVVSSQFKQFTISHCIVQAARPRSVVSPILLGMGVSLDHVFGSRWLIETLATLCLSASYDELNLYKQSCVQFNETDVQQCATDVFVQWSGDNVDHNVQTLDGSGSFHGMGIISMTTPCSRIPVGNFSEMPVVRMQHAKVSSIVKNRGIPLLHIPDMNKSSLSSIKFKPMSDLKLPTTQKPSLNLDLVWQTGGFFTDEQHPRPNWSGFMQDVTVPFGQFAPAADIRMLPIIDVNPNDRNCIYSTLRYVETEAKRLNMQTACITFDLPLWLKAVEIVQAHSMNVVCRLGAFHVLMSFLGSIGNIMAGSGLDVALENCYGPVSVAHMLTGKSVARAVRGHFLIDASLNVLMLEDILKPNVDGNIQSVVKDFEAQSSLYEKVIYRTFNTEADSDLAST